MSFVKLSNGFNYDSAVLDGARYSQERIARANELIESQKSLPKEEAWKAGWVAFNILRTNGDYRRLAESQSQEIHGVWQSYPDRGLSTCRCGLVADVFMNDTEFLKAPGHIVTETQELRTFFVGVPSETDEIKGKSYFCQFCGVIAPADTHSDGTIDLAKLGIARDQHSCALRAVAQADDGE